MSRSIAVTIEIRGDDGISDRQAIEEVNEALAAAGRHPLAVRQATTYEVRLGVGLFQVFNPEAVTHAIPTERCAACGNPRNPHNYRHLFVEWKPGMPEPKTRRKP